MIKLQKHYKIFDKYHKKYQNLKVGELLLKLIQEYVMKIDHGMEILNSPLDIVKKYYWNWSAKPVLRYDCFPPTNNELLRLGFTNSVEELSKYISLH